MNLFKNRKRSGMVLTGALAVQASISLVQQSVVSANDVLGSTSAIL